MSVTASSLVHPRAGRSASHLDVVAVASAACGAAASVVLLLPFVFLAAPALGAVALLLAGLSWQRRREPDEYGHLVAIIGVVTGATAVVLGVAAALVVAAAW